MEWLIVYTADVCTLCRGSTPRASLNVDCGNIRSLGQLDTLLNRQVGSRCPVICLCDCTLISYACPGKGAFKVKKVWQLALPHWKKLNICQFWRQIFKFESALQRLVTGNCTNARNCYSSIDSALVLLQPRTVTSTKIYTRLLSGQFVIGQIDTGKALNLSIHLTALCSIAWWTTCIQEGALLLFSPSNIQWLQLPLHEDDIPLLKWPLLCFK